ncbi:uncharacterized protein LDX57_003740 [Aspergillus melleus]|uniref:uncharacterized protein n=1 Tax=Aspergillus melleus TaxID=138277 RepID=UPI001E8CBB16|nr:uncharacterized protein LDX57_003740 [Aspergillus melleus]KAH8426002.1 hypothetical protein LDX57_003740 [Aspergillus melleus]
MSSTQNTHREFKIQKPPAYWHNLSTVWLTQGALLELQRRIGRSQQLQDNQRPSHSVTVILQQLGNRLGPLKRSSRRGGLDVSDLRGCRPPRADFGHGSMTRIPKSEQPQELSNGVTAQIPSTPYSLNFEQHLVDHQVYPRRYFYGETEEENEPVNLSEIQTRLTTRRPSLSPSGFSAADFEKVKTAYCTTSKEPQVSASVIPLIEGNISQHAGGGTLFNNLAPLTDGNISQAKPDIYYGARPEDLERQICNDLNDMIIPCTDDSLPIAPNFFMEVKGNSGDPSVSKRQACHYGALGARGIQALQSY